MNLRDTIGFTLATAGLLLLALGQPVLGPRSLLCGTVLLIIGVLMICLPKRRHESSEDSYGHVSLPGDEHHLSGSHGADMPDD
jgi:hypothetical protein